MKADAARAFTDAIEPVDVRLRAGRGSPFMPGHLELIGTQALFGVANGATIAMALGALPGADRTSITLAGGAAAALLGGTLGTATFFIADAAEISAGDARLAASGTGWGFGFGLALAPFVAEAIGVPWPKVLIAPLTPAFQSNMPLLLVPSAVLGYAGLAAGGLLAMNLELSTGQVATINTGGLTGVAIGLALTPLMDVVGLGDGNWLGALYLSTGVLGLGGGAFVSTLIDLSPGDVFLIDLATFASFALVGGSGYALHLAAGPNATRDGAMGTLTLLATSGALIGATSYVVGSRQRRGERVWRSALPMELRFFAGAPIIDFQRQAFLLPLLSGRF